MDKLPTLHKVVILRRLFRATTRLDLGKEGKNSQVCPRSNVERSKSGGRSHFKVHKSRGFLWDEQWLFIMFHKEDPLDCNRRVRVCHIV